MKKFGGIDYEGKIIEESEGEELNEQTEKQRKLLEEAIHILYDSFLARMANDVLGPKDPGRQELLNLLRPAADLPNTENLKNLKDKYFPILVKLRLDATGWMLASRSIQYQSTIINIEADCLLISSKIDQAYMLLGTDK